MKPEEKRLKLSDLLEREGISKQTLIRRIDSRMHGYKLDERFFDQYLNGELKAERAEALEKALIAEFPSFNGLKIKEKRSWNVKLAQVIYSLLGISFLAIIVAFFFFDDSKAWNKFEDSLGLIATLVSIIGFVLGLSWLQKR